MTAMADPLSLSDSLVLSRVHDAVLLLDHTHAVVSANERFFTWTLFATDQVVGRPVTEFWEDKIRWTDWLTVLRLAGAARDSEVLELKTRGGDPIPVEVHLAALPSKGRKQRTLLVLHDLRPLRLLEQLVRQDPLTGVASRSALLPRLEEELSLAAKYGTCLGVVLFDVDGFAALNAQWGPAFGDEVLRVVGAELREKAGAPRLSGRWGSDEFLLLLPQSPRELSLPAAEQLRQGFAARLFTPQGVEIAVTASLGVTSTLPTDHDTASTVLVRVTQALNRARKAGGNRVEFSP